MKVTNCRLCKGSLSEPVLKFPDTPLANEFLSTKEKQETFPLQVCVCTVCKHYQLNETVDPERLFRYYSFVAGTSKVNVEHFRQYAETVIKNCRITPGSRVMDIASNDGTLLRHFKDMGMCVVGIDPARNIAEEATKNGIPTIAEFFTEDFAHKMTDKFDLITANNVFAHTPDMIGFAKGIKHLLKPGGVFVFEVSHFVDVCEKLAFDTIYSEHSSYHTLDPLVRFFGNLDMQVFDVEKVNTHGGSIRVYVRPTYAMLHTWEEFNINSLMHQDMEAKVERLKKDIKLLGYELREKLQECKSNNLSIAIYGVPAKATTLMYALDIDENMIDFAVDDAPLKQGTFTPGKHIPILPPSALYERKPDVVLVLSWNFYESILAQHKALSCTWIVPIPELLEIH